MNIAVETLPENSYEWFVRTRGAALPLVPERISSVRKKFEKKIGQEPEFAGGYAGVSLMMSYANIWGHYVKDDSIARAVSFAEQAQRIDDGFAWSHAALGLALMTQLKFEDALNALQFGMECEPYDPDILACYALALGLVGRYDEAIQFLEKAIESNPGYLTASYLILRGQISVLAGKFEEAAEDFQNNEIQQGPDCPQALSLYVVALQAMGKYDEVKHRVERIRSEFQRFSLHRWNYLRLIENDNVGQQIVSYMREAKIPYGMTKRKSY
ncbi:MAG: tetratricopeptide (TPR) repeat protein [Gammaproteobacteria bacterium]|jgi:tetratricopeptide (TPR) repeat protein